MNILIVAATELEIAPLVHHLKANFKQLGTDIFFNDQHRVQVLVTGVGMVATTYHLTALLPGKSYDWVLQAGIAGAYDRRIRLGDLYWVRSEQIGDLGAEDHYNFLDHFELGLQDPDELPFRDTALINPISEFPFEEALPSATAITVNMVAGSDTTVEKRTKKYGCQLESMEGASLHYVCLQKNIPFLQIRAVSNYAEARDKTQWQLMESVAALNRWLIRLFS
ncbi:MAG TPA: futalosine hydrolase [Flavipsychrobacter sp.]|nr:futalosine hydrolase [Flavipsychrobacter sp.]